jgi:ADP-heptose:LPS heptosyltransferase
LRALGVGDLATAVPALRALRAAFPDRELVLAAPRWLAPLVDLVGGIDRLVPTDGLGPPAEPIGAVELAVNLHGRGPESHRLLQRLRPVRLHAFACAEAGHVDGPRWRADEHEVLRWCRLLRWHGIGVDPSDLALHRPPAGQAPAGVTIVHPGAKAAERRWPPARFGAVARYLAARGHRVVITGSPSERGIAHQVATHADLPATAVVAGDTDLADLAGLVAYGRLVISGDTGIGHLATAYGTPSVLLFGPVAPAQWGPPQDRPWHRAIWCGPVAAAPAPGAAQRAAGAAGRAPGAAGRAPGPHPALAAIDVPQVLAAVAEVERTGRVPYATR